MVMQTDSTPRAHPPRTVNSMALRWIVHVAAGAVLAGCGDAAENPLRDSTGAVEASGAAPSGGGRFEARGIQRDAPYVATPEETVEEMLRMAAISGDDLLYDLGSGDGRIVIAAARNHGTRGVGIDIDPLRVAEANEHARAAGVTDRVRFVEGDLFATDLRPATAVTLYLLPAVNLRLRPKLLSELRPGTPVVSHDYDMADWEPDDYREVGTSRLYLWIVPARVEGSWSWSTPDGEPRTASVRQEFQRFHGAVEGSDGTHAVRNGRLNGAEIAFELTRTAAGGAPGVVERYRGEVSGASITGTAEADGRRWSWRAQRE